jgi:probable O-glycosylation ligase (exosortase A-associated)
MRFVPGQRGGLAVLPPESGQLAPPVPQGAPVEPPTPDDTSRGDRLLFASQELKRVDWSLALLGFIVYIGVITTYQLGIGTQGMIAGLLGLLFLKEQPRFPAILGVFGMFVVWCAFGIIGANHPAIVQETVIELGKLWLIMLVGVNALRTRSQIRVFIVLFLLFYALFPARGTIFNFLWGFSPYGRTSWNFIYRNPNDLAAITLLPLSMAIGLLRTEPEGWFKRGAIAATVVLPVVIIITQSRGVFIALCVVGLIAFWKELRRLKSVLLLAVMVLTVWLVAPDDVWDRFGALRHMNPDNLIEADDQGSAEQRFQIWKMSLRIIADHPVTGVGVGTYGAAHGRYATVNPDLRLAGGDRDTHSTYLNIAASAGIPGLVIFLLLIGTALAHADRVRRRCRKMLPGASMQLYYLELGLIGFLLAGVFASYGRISFLYIHLAVMYCVARACEDDMIRLRRPGPEPVAVARPGRR